MSTATSESSAGHGMTQSEYARHRGVSRQAVCKALKEGRITALSDGTIDAEEADRQWPRPGSRGAQMTLLGVAASEARPDAAPAGGESGSYDEARARKEYYNAERARLRLEQELGELVRRDEVESTWLRVALTVRDRLMGLPERISAQLGALAGGRFDQERARQVVDAEVRAVLEELADGSR